MTVPGYRNTSPPMVFLDFSREPLERIGEGNFLSYTDPFDLKDTLKEFSYTLTKGDVPGVIYFTLINPSQQVEEKLFSWYASVAPKSWRASKEAQEKSIKSWAKEAAKYSNLFLRWGYINPNPENTAASDSIALSHIHEVLVYDLGYEISDKQDRIVTLAMLSSHDIDLIRQSGYSSNRYNSTVKVGIEEPGSREIREPASIMEEFLGELAGGDGTTARIALTEEQREVINKKFDELGTRDIPTQDNLSMNEIRDYSSDNRSANLGGYDTVRKFFNGLQVDAVWNAPPTNQQKTPEKKISLSQAPGTSNYVMSNNPIPEELVQAYNEQLLEIPVSTTARDFGPGTYEFETGRVIGGALLINPFSQLDDEYGNVKYSGLWSLAQIQMALNDDLVYIRPAYKATVANLPGEGLDLVESDSAFGREWYDAFSLAMTEFASEVDYQIAYKPSEHPDIRTTLELKLQKGAAELKNIEYEAVPFDINDQLYEDAGLLEENTTPPEDPPAEPVQGSYISCTVADRANRLMDLINDMNVTFFGNSSDYIETAYIPTSVVDTSKRQEFEKRFGSAVDWSKEKGILAVGGLSYINSLLGFVNEIKSFDIQLPDRPEKIILSTGFSTNKTNIITDLSYRQSKNGFFQDFMQSPIVLQQIYEVAKRFETKEYRDRILKVLAIEAKNGNAGTEFVSFSPTGEVVDTSTVQAFPEELADKAFAAATHYVTDKSDLQDSSNSEIAKSEVTEQLRKDLIFLFDNDLIEAFFPQVTENMVGSQTYRSVIGPIPLQTGSEAIAPDEVREIVRKKTYRFMAKSPLSLLTESASDEEVTASVLAAKLRQLQAFKARILNVRLRILGVPEMDVLAYELGKREVALVVSEPRNPGTYHWLTGVYRVRDVTHKISTTDGYVTEIELRESLSNTAEELLAMSFTFLEAGNA